MSMSGMCVCVAMWLGVVYRGGLRVVKKSEKISVEEAMKMKVGERGRLQHRDDVMSEPFPIHHLHEHSPGAQHLTCS